MMFQNTIPTILMLSILVSYCGRSSSKNTNPSPTPNVTVTPADQGKTEHTPDSASKEPQKPTTLPPSGQPSGPQIPSVEPNAIPVVFKNPVTATDVEQILADVTTLDAQYDLASAITFKDAELQEQYVGTLSFLSYSKARIRTYATTLKSANRAQAFEIYRSYLEQESKTVTDDASFLTEFADLLTSSGDPRSLLVISKAITGASSRLEAKFHSLKVP
ncbi:MAG: hypothetical protein M3Q07_18095 [Pseudobdellovibrionaceae bacterium]|nr:hypothetical protein [Pseudobdellovibrionaceae bacterium]